MTSDGYLAQAPQTGSEFHQGRFGWAGGKVREASC